MDLRSSLLHRKKGKKLATKERDRPQKLLRGEQRKLLKAGLAESQDAVLSRGEGLRMQAGMQKGRDRTGSGHLAHRIY